MVILMMLTILLPILRFFCLFVGFAYSRDAPQTLIIVFHQIRASFAFSKFFFSLCSIGLCIFISTTLVPHTFDNIKNDSFLKLIFELEFILILITDLFDIFIYLDMYLEKF